MICSQKTTQRVFGLLAMTLPMTVMAELSVTPYGSLRLQTEVVSVDQAVAGEDDSYVGIRDAYSHIGVKAAYPAGAGWNLGAKLEFPINLQTLNAEDPSYFEGFYKDNNAPRTGKVTASHDQLGTLSYGMQWLAYYNTIGYPVDYFSTFYGGFATYSTFRREALTYSTPSWQGLKLTASLVDMTTQDDSYLDTSQVALSFNRDNFSAGLAYEDQPQDGPSLLGVSAAYKMGQWRIASKVEQFRTQGANSDDPIVKNLYLSYQLNQYTFKGMVANGDKDNSGSAFFTGNSYQLGVDYHYTPNFKVFMEYFYEQNSYAIYKPNAKSFDNLATYGSESNGRALSLGVRYDF